MMYTQALVNGYWVVINAGGKTYDFRVDARGQVPLVPAGSWPSAATVGRSVTHCLEIPRHKIDKMSAS